MNSSAPAVTVFVAAFQRHPSPRTTLLRSVAPLEDVPCSFAEKSQSLLECRRTACRIRFPRSISRQPLRLAVTKRAEGEGFGAENVTLAAFRGRIRLPWSISRQPPAPGGHETWRGRRFRGRKRHPCGLPRLNPSPLRPPAAPRAPACREACRGRKISTGPPPYFGYPSCKPQPPTNGSISPCHRNCANATDRTPGR